MADQTFPPVHTTTTTVTSTNTSVRTDLRYDPMYVRTLHGTLKCVQIVSKIEEFYFKFHSYIVVLFLPAVN